MTATAPSPRDTVLWLSEPRFEPYLDAAGDHRHALALYVWDGTLAAACLEVARDVEVLLRNAVHRTLRDARPPNALQSWLLDGGLLAPREIERVRDAVTLARRSRRVDTEDGVVAALPFGFWVRLFGTRYEELWRRTLRTAFPHGDGTRHQIAGLTNRIAQMRNRIAHHEPLFNQPVLDRHDDLLALASAIDSGAGAWIEQRSRVRPTVRARP